MRPRFLLAGSMRSSGETAPPHPRRGRESRPAEERRPPWRPRRLPAQGGIYILDKVGLPLDCARQGGIVTPHASQEFEEFVLGWLDRNQEGLQLGGTGNLKELETLCVAWARSNNLLEVRE